MRRFAFRPRASDELITIVEWYESQRASVGDRFATSIALALDPEPARWPTAYPIFIRTQRRILIRPFPFGVIFLTEPDQITVTAVVDLRKEPRMIRTRLRVEE